MVLQMINSVLNAAHTFFWLASCAGRLIVAILLIALELCGKLFDNSILVAKALYDALLYFFEDFSTVLESINDGAGHFVQMVYNVRNAVLKAGCCILDGILDTFSAYKLIIKAAVFIKQVIVDTAGGFWFLITLISVNSVLAINCVITFIYLTLESIVTNTINAILDTLMFLMDMPPESILGAILFLTIVKLLEIFRLEVQNISFYLLYRTIRFIVESYDAIREYFGYNLEEIVIDYFERNPDIATDDEIRAVRFDPADENSHCVICHDRRKCILILPCKHLCLCKECCNRLYDYQRLCPICRTFIRRSVLIYV